ncbi:glycoside hydrolase family 75 protein [Streptomyces sp. NPDC087659]|uniref:glycoside hydrolase family 75 protein n=1 Tax=unclassified Streptomyces TaxID=2593676 RepID=UPI0036968BFA
MSRCFKTVAACGAALLVAAVLPATATARHTYEGSVSARELLAKVRSCTQISDGLFRTDADQEESIPVCGTSSVVFWKADLDIDCDGLSSPECNPDTDEYWQPETAYWDSEGYPLDSADLPFIVVPAASPLWDYGYSRIRGGTVAAVIYRDRVVYAVVGDAGPTDLIGEASHATARALGIDPDPAVGGVSSGVTYILFRDSRVAPIESHRAAVTLGDRLARKFVGRS